MDRNTMRRLMLGVALFTLPACHETPATRPQDAERLGLMIESHDRATWGSGCGRDMSGGPFQGTLNGSDVTGHWCCNRDRCFYAVD